MRYQTGEDRDQIFMTSLDQLVSEDSWARIIDLFVDSMPLQEFKFTHRELNKEGNIPYHPGDMFKLFLYGYRYRLRSANQLARNCKINVEVKWLMRNLEPSARTINYFRSKNEEAIKQAHQYFVRLLKEWELIGGKTLALDGTKVRGQNSKRNNYNARKINKHLQHIEGSISKYLERLGRLESKAEKTEAEEEKIKEIKKKLDQKEEKKKDYESLKEESKCSPDGQVSKVDPDARAVGGLRGGVYVGYNIQANVDAKHNIIVDVFSGRVNDTHELSKGAQRAKEILDCDQFDQLADAGYYTGSEIRKCEQLRVTPYVSPKPIQKNRKDGYSKSDFIYHPDSDTYICPQHQTLTTNGKHYQRSDRDALKIYRSGACKQCPKLAECVSNNKPRAIERSVYQEVKEKNNERVRQNPEYYKLRKQIVEPIFGTWKRYWDISYTLLKGRKKVETEFTIAAICYNLTRAVKILGVEEIKNELKKLLYIFKLQYQVLSNRMFSKRSFIFDKINNNLFQLKF